MDFKTGARGGTAFTVTVSVLVADVPLEHVARTAIAWMPVVSRAVEKVRAFESTTVPSVH